MKNNNSFTARFSSNIGCLFLNVKVWTDESLGWEKETMVNVLWDKMKNFASKNLRRCLQQQQFSIRAGG